MTTDIKWLVDILLNYKLPEPVKELFIARIGQIEESLSKSQFAPRGSAGSNIIQAPTLMQAPSTQRILDEIANETPLIKAKPVQVPAVIDKETGRAIINTGKGTSGPRKF